MRVEPSAPHPRRALLIAAICLLLGGHAQPFARSSDDYQTRASRVLAQRKPTVLFLCPHGAAKSILASAYFQQIAKERGLNVRVEAAGIEPQAAVSTVVAEHLKQNGYAVPVTKPRAVTKEDLDAADVVISMGCELSRLPATPRNLQKWDDVPGPGEDLKGADEVIRRRVIALVEELVGRQAK